YVKVLEYGEQVLAYNPWDTSAQLAMAQAFESLGLLDLAVWTLDQARQKNAMHTKVNRALAILYEKRGNFTQAMALWQLVRKADPKDLEAQHKAKDLAASATIARGRYEEAIQNNNQQTEETAAEHAALGQTQPALAPAAPAEDRNAKEAAVLRTRIQADP